MTNRFPLNVEGDFYTLGGQLDSGEWFCECLSCALPEAEAPTLLAPLDDSNDATYFIRQPETESELEQAIMACDVCCVSAVRYGGKDKAILKRMCHDVTDYKIDVFGRIVPSSTPWWKLW